VRQVSGAEEVLHNWEQLKLEEGQGSALEGVPASLPALLRASRMLSKAERSGFVWSSADEARAKISEELQELEAELEPDSGSDDAPTGRASAHEELGDLLLALVSYAHFHRLEPESSLREAADRFDRRFRRMERMIGEGGHSVKELTASELIEAWNQAAEAGGRQER
jgi:XTP/dITP diphosphohydrolase